MFIVIEGIDGSGKETQVRLLKEKLRNLGKKVKTLDYPRYGKKSAFGVEKYLNGEYGNDISAKQASILYAIDRFDDSMNLKNDLSHYDYIITNRYVSASMIHQGGKIDNFQKRQQFLDWLYDLEYNIFGILMPDTIIFLNVSPIQSQKLILKKEKRNYLKKGQKMDIHEADIQHLQNAWENAIQMTKKYNWIQIECEKDGEMKSIENIHKEILKKIL